MLVVDDNDDAADTLAKLLKLWGNETAIAFDGVEALGKAASFKPDLILLDVGLPKMNGLDACRAIRDQPGGKDVFIAALTGWGKMKIIGKQRKRGATGIW